MNFRKTPLAALSLVLLAPIFTSCQSPVDAQTRQPTSSENRAGQQGAGVTPQMIQAQLDPADASADRAGATANAFQYYRYEAEVGVGGWRAWANCPTGMIAISGGLDYTPDGVSIRESRPGSLQNRVPATATQKNRWTVGFLNSNSTSKMIGIYVVCTTN